MLSDDLRTIAIEAGDAVVESLGAELWTSFGQQIAAWLAPAGGNAEQAEFVRLAETAVALRTTTGAYATSIAARHALEWQVTFADALERLSPDERVPAAERLRRLTRDHSAGSKRPSAAPGVINGENVRIQADHSSFAAGVVNGDVHMTSPTVPDPTQG